MEASPKNEGLKSSAEERKKSEKERAAQLCRWREWERQDALKERTPSIRQHIDFEGRVKLLAACADGDEKEARLLIQGGLDPNCRNADGLSPLHQAALDGSMEMTELLIGLGADVNVRDRERWTPLHAAANSAHLDVVKYLLDHGADLLSANCDGLTALDVAKDSLENEEDENATEAIKEVINFLQQQHKNQNVTSQKLAEIKKYFEQAVLEDAKYRIATKTTDFRGDAHSTILHVAASHGFLDVVTVLVEAGVNVNSKDEDGWTPLHAAVHWNRPDVVKYLALHGANLNAKTNYGELYFEVADSEDAEMAQLLTSLPAIVAAAKPKKERSPSPVEEVFRAPSVTSDSDHNDQVSESSFAKFEGSFKKSRRGSSITRSSNQDRRSLSHIDAFTERIKMGIQPQSETLARILPIVTQSTLSPTASATSSSSDFNQHHHQQHQQHQQHQHQHQYQTELSSLSIDNAATATLTLPTTSSSPLSLSPSATPITATTTSSSTTTTTTNTTTVTPPAIVRRKREQRHATGVVRLAQRLIDTALDEESNERENENGSELTLSDLQTNSDERGIRFDRTSSTPVTLPSEQQNELKKKVAPPPLVPRRSQDIIVAGSLSPTSATSPSSSTSAQQSSFPVSPTTTAPAAIVSASRTLSDPQSNVAKAVSKFASATPSTPFPSSTATTPHPTTTAGGVQANVAKFTTMTAERQAHLQRQTSNSKDQQTKTTTTTSSSSSTATATAATATTSTVPSRSHSTAVSHSNATPSSPVLKRSDTTQSSSALPSSSSTGPSSSNLHQRPNSLKGRVVAVGGITKSSSSSSTSTATAGTRKSTSSPTPSTPSTPTATTSSTIANNNTASTRRFFEYAKRVQLALPVVKAVDTRTRSVSPSPKRNPSSTDPSSPTSSVHRSNSATRRPITSSTTAMPTTTSSSLSTSSARGHVRSTSSESNRIFDVIATRASSKPASPSPSSPRAVLRHAHSVREGHEATTMTKSKPSHTSHVGPSTQSATSTHVTAPLLELSNDPQSLTNEQLLAENKALRAELFLTRNELTELKATWKTFETEQQSRMKEWMTSEFKRMTELRAKIGARESSPITVLPSPTAAQPTPVDIYARTDSI